jgi:uncharacterized protein
VRQLWAAIMMLFSTAASPVLPQIVPTPIPFEFNELTIPYLRDRAYDSQIGELRQIGQNNEYTSFITNYDSDGLDVNSLLTIPRNPGPHPAIIFIHGYIQPARYQTTVNYSSYVDFFARNGFVVFKIDLRGHGTSEGEAGGAYYSSDYVIDTLNAYSALEKQDFVGSIGLWGHSMAGNVVSRSIAAKPDIPAAVIWAGAGYTYSDITEYGIDDNSYQPPPQNAERARKRQMLRQMYGDFDPDSWFWRQIPATNYISEFQGAVQIHHAVDDNVVSIEYSRNLVNLLDLAKITNEYYEYSSGGHNLSGSSFNSAMSRSVEFFKDKLE